MMVVTAAVALPPSASSSPSPSHEPASPSPNLLSGSLNGTLTMDGESPSSAPPTPVNGNGTNGMNAAAATVTSASSSNGGGVYPRASLVCRPNSHPFQDRTLTLDQSVKVGRSVARARPAPANAIFDCKVLSRNHALLWYEQGKFYLQDTKSSNGTFVNNQRLSKGSEESLPREVCSGDILQFGVDVMENSRKVTHGCIIATLKLYLPDGKEAKASPTIMSSSGMPGDFSKKRRFFFIFITCGTFSPCLFEKSPPATRLAQTFFRLPEKYLFLSKNRHYLSLLEAILAEVP